MQFCPCFRQQVLLKRAHGGTSPSPPSLIGAWVSDNSWPIIKLCRNKIFPNGAEAIILKGVGWRINQKTAVRSITRSFIRWQDLAQIRFWRAGSESDLQIPHCSENAFYTTIVLAPTIWASISEGFCLLEESAKNPIQPWSPVLITCLKPSPRSNNAWFSDCKSNYENPVNPSDFGSYEVVAATTLVESNQKPSVFDRAEYFYRRLIHCRSGRCWALFEQNVNLFSNYANFFYERCHTYFGGSGPVLRWFTL